MEAVVHSVNKITLTINKSNPPQLVIEAEGKVTTGGWTNGRLTPYIYTVPPADGIWDFSFVATPPTGIVTQRISPIDANSTVPMQLWLTGVRVHASTGEPVVAMLDDVGCDASKISTESDVLPWPWVISTQE